MNRKSTSDNYLPTTKIVTATEKKKIQAFCLSPEFAAKYSTIVAKIEIEATV